MAGQQNSSEKKKKKKLWEKEALDYKLRGCWEDKEKAERLSSLVNAPDCWSSESVKSVLKSSPIPQSLSQGANT